MAERTKPKGEWEMFINKDGWPVMIDLGQDLPKHNNFCKVTGVPNLLNFDSDLGKSQVLVDELLKDMRSYFKTVMNTAYTSTVDDMCHLPSQLMSLSYDFKC